MIRITLARSYHCDRDVLFNIISDIHKLSNIKKDIRGYKVVRDELGLQIVDVNYNLFLMQVNTRLSYITRPGMLAELKQIKGNFESFYCNYHIKDSGEGSILEIDLSLKLPYGPLGFIISKIKMINIRMNLTKELRSIEKLIKENI